MNSLGIYFGPQIISIVETKNKTPVNNIQIPRSAISGGGLLEEKVPEEVKIIALIKNELRARQIEPKEVTIGLSGKDLIVRTFEVPIIPSNELPNVINFEAKKYMPFKVEELVSDCQWKLDKSIQKNHALFVGIKKEALEKYRSMLSQLGLKINSIEYSAFSVLRLLKLADVREAGIIAVVDIDLIENDEVNFVVLEKGFPLFSRDITFIGGPADVAEAKEASSGMALEKLKREIRISLDYYHRKFPAKNIEKVYFISAEDCQPDLEAFIKDIGLSAQFIDIAKFIGKAVPFSLSFIKGYSSSLFKIIKTSLKINLLVSQVKAGPLRAGISLRKIALPVELKINPGVLIAGLLICILSFVFGLSRVLPLQKELKDAISNQQRIAAVEPAAGYEELVNIESGYKEKIGILDGLIKKQLYLTSLLDIMPRLMPEGMWLENLSFRRGEAKSELILEGIAYLGDSTREFAMVNNFISDLKKEQDINLYFKEVNLVSLNREQIREESMTKFRISCLSH